VFGIRKNAFPSIGISEIEIPENLVMRACTVILSDKNDQGEFYCFG